LEGGEQTTFLWKMYKVGIGRKAPNRKEEP